VSLAGRLLTFFPAFVIACAAGTVVAMITTRSPLWMLALLFCIYGLPLLTFRAVDLVRPLREGRSFLDGPRYSPWWGSHNIQRIYIAFPQIESLLQLIPGAFSLWLRLWGSRIGHRVYWTPRVEIADRSLLDVGDDVVFAHKIECFAHAIKPRRGRLVLYVRRIRIGNRVFVGAGTRIGPDARVADGAFVPILSDLYVSARVEAAP
jgi:hypothetical protein